MTTFIPTIESAKDKLLTLGFSKQDVYDAHNRVKGQLNGLYDIGAAVRSCHDCSLRNDCKRTVPGMGPITSRIMILGESPGEDDMEVGAPFVGASGHLLTLILNKAGILREEIYITNIIKCGGRKTLTFQESQNCLHHFYNEVAVLQPQFILALGAAPLKILQNDPELKITQERGKWFTEQTFGIPYMVTYNPAYLFHLEGDELRAAKNQMWRDIKTFATHVAQN